MVCVDSKRLNFLTIGYIRKKNIHIPVIVEFVRQALEIEIDMK